MTDNAHEFFENKIANEILTVHELASRLKITVSGVYTKTKMDRRVSVPKPVLQILMDKSQLAPTTHVFDLLFNSLGWRKIRPMAIEAGVKTIRFHDLRHTFASHLVMRGKHPVEIKEVLGHTKLDTTMKYMHLAEDRNKGLTDCLTEGMSWVNPGDAEVIPFRKSFS